jgi:hypothetical protein
MPECSAFQNPAYVSGIQKAGLESRILNRFPLKTCGNDRCGLVLMSNIRR